MPQITRKFFPFHIDESKTQELQQHRAPSNSRPCGMNNDELPTNTDVYGEDNTIDQQEIQLEEKEGAIRNPTFGRDQCDEAPVRLQHCLDFLNLSTSKAASRLPPEIWWAIFQRAVPPNWLLDPSLSLGSGSSWCFALRMKKSIVAVCKSWHDFGLPLLYEDIFIRRFPQFWLLLRSLKTSPSSPGAFIKTLNLLSYVPEASERKFKMYLKTLFPFMPGFIRLRALPLLPVFRTFQRYHSRSLVSNFLRRPLRGRSLRIPLLTHDVSVGARILLPCLTSLFLEHTFVYDEQGFQFFTQHFHLPSLSKCTIYHNSLYGHLTEDINQSVIAFLAQHGTNLEFLNHHYHYNPTLSLHSGSFFYRLHGLQRFCPNLKHLIIPASVIISNGDWLDGFAHPKLQWIDFNLPVVLKAKEHLSKIILLRQNLPALRGSRMLSDVPHSSCEWLHDFLPDAVTEGFVIDFFPNQLLHRQDYIHWQQPQWYQSSGAHDTYFPEIRTEAGSKGFELLIQFRDEAQEDESDSSESEYVPETDSSESTDELASDVDSEYYG
ncbi:hypothetical protein NLJ89_g1908 [Agrocybe chaxingu]|uniref:F-box domain-containing protein n=1 Tax=Agrocybe chaxingu TaxID=84603 RepID=A0A9W8MZ58_9AGAR|nr:hypothetical protein NLJ89_g1908 [Agrocybe chaxingu]